MLRNLRQLLIAADQTINCLIFLFAKQEPYRPWGDESLSSHCWRLEQSRGISWPRKLVDRLLWFDKDHCRESFESELERRQLPPSLRG